MKFEELSEKERQPNLVDSVPIFEWGLGNLIDEEECDMGEIIQNVEHMHPPFTEKEIVDDIVKYWPSRGSEY